MNAIYEVPKGLQGGLPNSPSVSPPNSLHLFSAQPNQSPCKCMNVTNFLIHSCPETGNSYLQSSHLSSHVPSPNSHTLQAPKLNVRTIFWATTDIPLQGSPSNLYLPFLKAPFKLYLKYPLILHFPRKVHAPGRWDHQTQCLL